MIWIFKFNIFNAYGPNNLEDSIEYMHAIMDHFIDGIRILEWIDCDKGLEWEIDVLLLSNFLIFRDIHVVDSL